MKNKFLKNCLALFVITLVAGVSLAFVNEVTKEPIAKAQDKARLEAYEVVYPNAEFKVMDNSDEILKASSKSLEKENLSQFSVDDVLAVTDKNGNLIGYVFSATLLFYHIVKLPVLVLKQLKMNLNLNLSANRQTV